MKYNLIKSLLMSSLILGGVWNHDVGYSSDQPTIRRGAELSAPETKRARGNHYIALTQVKTFCKSYHTKDSPTTWVRKWKESGLLNEDSEKIFPEEELSEIIRTKEELLKRELTKEEREKIRQDELLKRRLTEEEFQNITMFIDSNRNLFREERVIEEVYDLYKKKGILMQISGKPGLYPTELSGAILKGAIKQIYMMYDLLKYQVLRMNEEDITENEYLRVYLIENCDCLGINIDIENLKKNTTESKKILEEILKKAKRSEKTYIKKLTNTRDREKILKDYKEKFREYQKSFQPPAEDNESDKSLMTLMRKSCRLDCKIKRLESTWMYCSIFNDLNYLRKPLANLAETLRNFLIPSGEKRYKVPEIVVNDIHFGFRNLAEFLGFYNHNRNASDQDDLFRTAYDEVDKEYESKDGLALAYCNYHFSRENGNLQLLFRYFEKASLSNPIFIQDIKRYFNFSNFDELRRLISLMESNHCFASLNQFFKEPLKLEGEEKKIKRKSDLITRENPPLKKRKWIENDPVFNPTQDIQLSYNYLGDLKQFVSLDEGRKKLKRNERDGWITGEDLSLKIKNDPVSNYNDIIELMLYDVANEDPKQELIYQAINYLKEKEIDLWDEAIVGVMTKNDKYKNYISSPIPHSNARKIYDQVYKKLDEDDQKKLRNGIKELFIKSIFTRKERFDKYQHYFDELTQMVNFMYKG